MADHARSDDPAVQAQLDRFAQLSPGRDTLGLERITALLATLGNPQDHLPPVFHVAGTNGKGSTCAFLRAILEAAGLKVHVYTSPHLVRFNERIRVAGKLIEDEDLAPLLSEVLNRAEAYDIGPSFFEATTAAAFLAFSRTPADACIVEVGLGGRLDATNVIKKPAICGIASLGMDHESFLLAPEEGVPPMPDFERIGFEKAGIAKTGVSLVSQAYPEPVQRRIADEAAYKMASYLPRGELWDASTGSDGVHYRDMGGEITLPLPRMVGAHQADNAALAIAMIRHQEAVAVPEAAFASGLTSAEWPARFQRLSIGPLTKGRTVWIDGAHNPAAATVLASELSKRPMHLIIGILANKDADGIISELKSNALSRTFVAVPDHASHDPAALSQKWGGRVATDLSDALVHLDDNILIVGSLYLAGVALKLNNELPD
jgi:dihydrofolate synthase / folylpolyglutamate synthase